MPTRAETVAAALAQPRSFAFGAFQLSLPEGVKRILVRNEAGTVVGDAIEFTLVALKNGVPVAVDNPIRIVNPPTQVKDGTFTSVYNAKLERTVRRANYTTNIPLALRQAIRAGLRNVLGE